MSDQYSDPEHWKEFVKDIESTVNKYSKENDSNTPDFILAEFLRDCLHAWNASVTAREKWYGRESQHLGERAVEPTKHDRFGHKIAFDPECEVCCKEAEAHPQVMTAKEWLHEHYEMADRPVLEWMSDYAEYRLKEGR
jgi:hypothetical protein